MSFHPPRRLVLIGGPARSGTTMLANILSQPPAGPFLPECSVLTSIINHRLELERTEHPLKFRAFLGSADNADQVYRGFIESVVAGLFEKAPSASVLVLKDPYLVHRYPVLHRFFKLPIRTIFIYREPKDIVASLLKVFDRRGDSPNLERAMQMTQEFFDGVANSLANQNDANPLLLCRYEALVQNYEAEIARLRQFVGYDFQTHNPAALDSSQIDRASPWHSENYGCPPTAKTIGSYATILSSEEADQVDRRFAEVISALEQSYQASAR